MLSQGISSFRNELENSNMAERVLLVVCSEFGRTLKENDTNGTEHGYINHTLVLGTNINSGIYGKLSLSADNSNQIV